MCLFDGKSSIYAFLNMIFVFVVSMTVSHNRKVVAQHKTPLDYTAVRKTASYTDELLILLTFIRKYRGVADRKA